MRSTTWKALPAVLLLMASGVATGATIMHYLDQGTVAWSRLLSALLLLGFAVGASRSARR